MSNLNLFKDQKAEKILILNFPQIFLKINETESGSNDK
jgi:hypothetical protein